MLLKLHISEGVGRTIRRVRLARIVSHVVSRIGVYGRYVLCGIYCAHLVSMCCVHLVSMCCVHLVSMYCVHLVSIYCVHLVNVSVCVVSIWSVYIVPIWSVLCSIWSVASVYTVQPSINIYYIHLVITSTP